METADQLATYLREGAFWRIFVHPKKKNGNVSFASDVWHFWMEREECRLHFVMIYLLLWISRNLPLPASPFKKMHLFIALKVVFAFSVMCKFKRITLEVVRACGKPIKLAKFGA